MNESWKMELHNPFILKELLPFLHGHAVTNEHPIAAVALASFLAMIPILEHYGMSRAEMHRAVDAARRPEHKAPEGLQ